jgi:ADP-ribosylglycohydrolase
VWVTKPNTKTFVLSVVRDALTTHGHPHGFCGAVFHALALADTLDGGRPSAPSQWYDYLHTFSELPTIISQERQLAAFWRPAWEQVAGGSFVAAVAATCDELQRDLDEIRPLIEVNDPDAYHAILRTLGCLEVKYRGSGLKTALAASALSWLYHEKPLKDALVMAANEIGSDTDTIATMAGAILGATTSNRPDWPIQDQAYIAE